MSICCRWKETVCQLFAEVPQHWLIAPAGFGMGYRGGVRVRNIAALPLDFRANVLQGMASGAHVHRCSRSENVPEIEW